MKTRHSALNIGSRMVVGLFVIFSLSFCKKEEPASKQAEQPSAATTQLSSEQVASGLSDYISAFTGGEISKTSTILVQFSDEQGQAGQSAPADLFSFEPDIDGAAQWKDSRTLEFKPEEYLKSGQTYSAELHLKKLIPGVPEALTDVQFQFKTITPFLELEIEPLRAADDLNLEMLKLQGKIISSDFEEGDQISEVLSARAGGQSLAISWTHDAEGKSHEFTIPKIRRKKNPYELRLSWDARDLGIDFKGNRNLTIVPLQDFKFIKAEPRVTPERHILLSFSDPLKKDQDLNGLVRLVGQDAKFTIDGNFVKVYAAAGPSSLSGTLQLVVEPGIRNAADTKLIFRKKTSVRFEEINPEVELMGKGVITPSTEKVLMPFRAVNLKAVDIQIIKIYEKNIPYFLQVNNLLGSRDLYRVGRVVAEQKLALDDDPNLDLKEWNRFSLDLSKIITVDPGALYQVQIGFRQSYSLYSCAGESEFKDRSPFQILRVPNEYSSWDYWEYGYDSYRHRNDPCHWAYYGPNRTKKKNILASDLGMIAKRSDLGSMTLFLTDINTTQPVSGASLDIFDFQNQLIKTVSTDGDGKASLNYERMPFLVVARKGKQRGYLKLLDGESNSLSRFDISGVNTYKGVKGFIFGERGVWRPGDTLHVTFMLEDPEKSLPKEHPVSFELSDPRGRVVDRQVQTEGHNGFYVFKVHTDPDAPTGSYQGTVRVGGTSFSKIFRVETIMPNRLKIHFSINKDFIQQNDIGTRGVLDVAWLHGAVAKNLKTDIQVTLQKAQTRFNKFNDYIFDSPVRDYSPHSKTIYDKNTDETGHAEFPIHISANNNAPGMLKACFACKVFEPGGAFSRDQFCIPYHPYKTYVGVKLPKGGKRRGMLLTDKDHPIKIVTLKPDGTPVSRQDVQVAVYKISWRWWWDHSKENLTNYNSRSLSSAVTSGKVSTGKDGTAIWNLRINYPSWGRYLVMVTDPGGHSSGKIVYIDWPGWAGRPQAEQPGGASMITIASDKTNYLVGDKVQLTFPSGSQGRALVSLETGSKVLASHWVETQKGVTKFTFTAGPNMTPNIYAHVTLVQPHAQTANDLPIRLYGVLPILIENPATRLSPKIDMPDVLRPEESVTVKVSEAHGNAMSYVLAMVDEGLLDLTRFKTPDPWGRFYARTALKVKTWDNFEQIIGAVGHEFDRLLAVGGDEEAEGAEPESQVNRFRPVVKFIGPFDLDKGKTNQHAIRLPMYVGSVRTMVIAGRSDAYGSAEKATPVRKPLMLIGTLPRVLAPTEELEFFLSVFAMDDNIKNVKISIDTGQLIELTGSASQTLDFDQPGDQMVSFPVKVKNNTGVAQIRAQAVSGGESAEYNFSIDIRNPNPMTTQYLVQVLEPGAGWDYAPQAVGVPGTNSGFIEVSSIRPIDLTGRLEYLIRYPHGCIEQTTSSVFPQLYLSKLVQLDEPTRQRTEDYIRMGIDRISLFQLSNGGITYWPGADHVDEWASNYAGHFMLEAKKLGYALPPDFLQKWLAFQKEQAENWERTNERSELIQAYRLFLLALADQPSLGGMNRFREAPERNNVATWMLAAGYQLSGQNEVAKALTNGLSTEVAAYNELGYTYGSDLRDKAIILSAMSLMQDYKKGLSLAEYISNRISDNRWHSTQTVAYCLLSLAKFYGDLDRPLKFSYNLNKTGSEAIDIDRPIYKIDLPMEKSRNKISLRNESDQRIFAKSVLSGIPAISEETASQNEITLSVSYKDLTGMAVNPAMLNQGSDFYAVVEVYNPGNRGNYEQLALTQIFPSGWEILNSSSDDNRIQGYDMPTYRDVRDDRVYTYFNLNKRQKKIFAVLLNASYRGKYYLPPAQVEAMYDNSIQARNKGQWVEVVKK